MTQTFQTEGKKKVAYFLLRFQGPRLGVVPGVFICPYPYSRLPYRRSVTQKRKVVCKVFREVCVNKIVTVFSEVGVTGVNNPYLVRSRITSFFTHPGRGGVVRLDT